MNEKFSYVIKEDAPYVAATTQKEPTGILPAGTFCALINDGDTGGRVRTEDGIEGWVAWDKVEKLEFNYVIKEDAPYVAATTQKEPTGILPAGTRCVLINDGDMGGRVRTEDGIEGWVSWGNIEKLEPS